MLSAQQGQVIEQSTEEAKRVEGEEGGADQEKEPRRPTGEEAKGLGDQGRGNRQDEQLGLGFITKGG